MLSNDCADQRSHVYRLKRAFNKAALTYDAASFVQQKIGMKLIELLASYHVNTRSIEMPLRQQGEAVFQQRSAIDMGCGSGWVTEALYKRHYYRSMHAIDFAERLLVLAKNRLEPYGVQVYAQNFDTFTSDERFDLIFANMCLHWSEHLLETIQHFATYMHLGGILAFSIPLQGTFNEISTYCASNTLPTPSVMKQMLKKTPYVIHHYEEERVRASFPNFLSALRSIKQTGANFVTQRGVLDGSMIVGMRRALKSHGVEQRFTLTYNVAYVIASFSQDMR